MMFIVFEGPDRSGKSGLLETVSKRLDAETTKEPGGTEVGQQIREILLNNDLDPKTETLLFAADRARHFEEKIKDHEGKLLISDRFFESTIVNQNILQEVDSEIIRVLHWFTTGRMTPDKTYIISSEEPHGEIENEKDMGSYRESQVYIYKRLCEDNGKFNAAPYRYPIEYIDTTQGNWDEYADYLVEDIKRLWK